MLIMTPTLEEKKDAVHDDVDGDNRNGESDKAHKAAFNTDFSFNIPDFFAFGTRLLKKEPSKGEKDAPCMIVFCAFQQIPEVIRQAEKHGFKNYIPLVFCKNYSPQVLKANMKIVGATEYALVLYRGKLPKFRNLGEDPAEENVFKQLRLNMWVSSLTRFIPEYIYDLGKDPIDMRSLEGRDCYGGLDLSSTGDITAFVLMFPPRDENEKYIMLPFFWIPEDTIPIRVRRASVPYDVWRQQGYLLATEGNVIHYGFIEQFIHDLGEKYHILEIAFDRWGATQMTQDLEGMGFTVVPFGQGYASMSPPTKEFYKLLMEGRIQHGGNPVMRWMAGNVVVDTDPAGNIKCTKARSPEKIDGIVAAIMALDRCIRHEGENTGSVYDDPDHGLLIF